MISSRVQLIHGEPSVALFRDQVRAWVTLRGGMIAPVEFDLGRGNIVRPYSLPPWQPAETAPGTPPLIQVLRGDFFCFPFGSNPKFGATHGPTANETWQLTGEAPGCLQLVLNASHLPARITKTLSLRAGETNLYQRHEILANGAYNYGHHPILHIPDGIVVKVRTSEFRFGGVYPGHIIRPEGERGLLAAGSRFDRLDAVPLAAGGTANLRHFPARPETEDIVMLSGFTREFAWVAITFPHYVWFALRRTEDFPSTLFWMSEGGRSQLPWSGRHRQRIGVEDVCSHYCDGLEQSRQALLADRGIATVRHFHPDKSVALAHVQGVVATPAGFGGVTILEPAPGSRTQAVLRDEWGLTVTTPLDWTHFDSKP